LVFEQKSSPQSHHLVFTKNLAGKAIIWQFIWDAPAMMIFGSVSWATYEGCVAWQK